MDNLLCFINRIEMFHNTNLMLQQLAPDVANHIFALLHVSLLLCVCERVKLLE
jgi:hypothetical protein